MARLGELANLIRSKNAGPFELTFDIMFDDAAVYDRVKLSGCLNASVVSRLYRVPEKDVRFFLVDNARAIKFSIPRPIVQGDPRDADSHGGQQYPPLMEIEVA